MTGARPLPSEQNQTLAVLAIRDSFVGVAPAVYPSTAYGNGPRNHRGVFEVAVGEQTSPPAREVLGLGFGFATSEGVGQAVEAETVAMVGETVGCGDFARFSTCVENLVSQAVDAAEEHWLHRVTTWPHPAGALENTFHRGRVRLKRDSISFRIPARLPAELRGEQRVSASLDAEQASRRATVNRRPLARNASLCRRAAPLPRT